MTAPATAPRSRSYSDARRQKKVRQKNSVGAQKKTRPPKKTRPYKNALDRRADFIDAAIELFMQRGISEVTLQDIVRYSGGSRTTLYELFGSKEGLIVAATTLAGERLHE